MYRPKIAATNRLHPHLRGHLTTNIDYLQIQKLENNYKEYLTPPKMPKYAEKYAICALC